MKKRRGLTWARFALWSVGFTLNSYNLGNHLAHPDWWIVLYLAALLVCFSAAKEAWTDLEESA